MLWKDAEVVEWQTRTFEGRVAQAVRVQVPPSAPNFSDGSQSVGVSLPVFATAWVQAAQAKQGDVIAPGCRSCRARF